MDFLQIILVGSLLTNLALVIAVLYLYSRFVRVLIAERAPLYTAQEQTRERIKRADNVKWRKLTELDDELPDGL